MEHAIERRDPRLNAPPRISDLQGEERRIALLARDRGRREAYMAAFGQPKPSLLRRVLQAALG